MPPKLETRQQLSKHMISFSNEGNTTTHAIYLSWLNPLNCTSLHAVMSYAYTPSSGANTDSTHATWQQRKTNTQASVADKINNIISSHDQGGLPMYKDKPYNYASSGRKRPFYQQKRLMLALLGVLTWILYFVGAFSCGSGGGSDERTRSSKGVAGWFSGGSRKVDIWGQRREKVRDAFKISWKAYEENAWGMVACRGVHNTEQSGLRLNRL